MSKQKDAKAKQNYRTEPNACGNCQYYQSQYVEKRYDAFDGLHVWDEEKNKKCTLGGFVVKKMAICDQHKLPSLTQQ